jgi:hypothetical protein
MLLPSHRVHLIISIVGNLILLIFELQHLQLLLQEGQLALKLRDLLIESVDQSSIKMSSIKMAILLSMPASFSQFLKVTFDTLKLLSVPRQCLLKILSHFIPCQSLPLPLSSYSSCVIDPLHPHVPGLVARSLAHYIRPPLDAAHVEAV